MDAVKVGHWAFVLGVLLALLAGFGGADLVPQFSVVLFVLGLIVGFLNVTEKESTSFLVAVVALLLIGVSGLQLGTLNDLVSAIVQNLIAFVSAAGLVVALKQVLTFAKAEEK